MWSVAVWLLEGAEVQASQPAPLPELLGAGRANLFFYELTGITTALVLGLWWAGISDGHTRATWFGTLRERWTALAEAPSEARRRLLARAYALVGVVAGCSWLAFHGARDAALRIANRDNLGLAMVGMHLIVLLFGLAAVRVVERGICRALEQLGDTRSQSFLRLRWHASVVFALCLGLLASVLIGFREPLAELVRRYAAASILGFFIAAGSAKLAPRLCLSPRARRVTSLCTLALFAASGVSGALVRQVSQHAWAKAPVARVALGWGHFWLDWDRDGHLSGFGDRDCAPLDASRHPGALDVPGNRNDEDCDGADAVTATRPLQPPLRRTGADSAGSTRPNLYLITIDAFAVGTLEGYGGAPGVAPSLNRFAKHSVVFENFFVQGPSTRLSLPALFTSRFDTRIDHVLRGRFPFELAPSNRMLAEVLADAGYDTRAVLPSPYFSPEHWRGLLQGFRGIATRPAEAYASGVPHTASAVTDAALEVLQRQRSESLFLWAHYFDAHPPHVLPEGQTPRGSTDAELYAAEITHLDRHVGRLIDHIVAHDPNHVVVVTSDHGMAFDEPRHEQDHYGYDLSTLVLHVPLMVRAAALTPRRIANLTDALDLAPTFASLAGISPPESFMGHSLVPLLLEKASSLPSVRFAQLYLGEEALRGREPLVMVSARTAEHNLVFDRRAGTVAAWRWQDDPEERHDRWPDVLTVPQDESSNLPHRPVRPPSPAAGDEIAKLRALKDALDAHLYEALAPSSSPSYRSHNETNPK